MATRTLVRKIVKIDEDKCNGCGLCALACAEGAIRIEGGKARLAADNLCDGLGNCLGECPQGAITIEERPAVEFDEAAVEAHLGATAALSSSRAHVQHAGCPGATTQPIAAGPHPGREVDAHSAHGHSGCPGSMMRMLKRPAHAPRSEGTAANPDLGVGTAVAPGSTVAPSTGATPRPSQLSQWPVQLALVPVAGPMWQDADVLIAADCVPFALPGFHEDLLAGKSLAIACPKLDDMAPYVEKMAAIFAKNTIRSITVAHMEVPCCTGIVYAVREALERAGRADIPLHDVTVGVEGGILERS